MKYDEKRTNVDFLLKDIRAVKMRVHCSDSKSHPGKKNYFLFKLQFFGLKNSLISEVDTGDKRGEWKTLNLNQGEKIIGIYGKLKKQSLIGSLGLVLTTNLIWLI